MRVVSFFYDCYQKKDFCALILCVWIAVVIGWALSMVFSTTMREMALRRFHLSSGNFYCWAVNQCVPAMYNHENRIQFTNELIGQSDFDTSQPSYRSETLNHFPARFITFGDHVPRCFNERRQGTFEMKSRCADTTLTSRWEISQRADGTMVANTIGSTLSRETADE